jgi:hypothetical protein
MPSFYPFGVTLVGFLRERELQHLHSLARIEW